MKNPAICEALQKSDNEIVKKHLKKLERKDYFKAKNKAKDKI